MTLWVIKILVYKYGNLTHLIIISVSKYVKTNGNNPIHVPLQMTSEVRVPTEQRETQAAGESRQRRSGNAREQHCGGVGGERVLLPCYPLRGPITEIADPVPALTI